MPLLEVSLQDSVDLLDRFWPVRTRLVSRLHLLRRRSMSISLSLSTLHVLLSVPCDLFESLLDHLLELLFDLASPFSPKLTISGLGDDEHDTAAVIAEAAPASTGNW